LARCCARHPDFHGITHDLEVDWPIPRAYFGLAVSLHSLHCLTGATAFIHRMHGCLLPGGLALLTVLKGCEGEPESILSCLRRISSDMHTREALNFAPWKILDALMRRLIPEPQRFFTPDSLRTLLEQGGFRVRELRLTFNCCSLLVLAEKERTS
jgi:hypothetical protein